MKIKYGENPTKRMCNIMPGQAFIRRYEDRSYSIYLKITPVEGVDGEFYNCVDLDDGCLESLEDNVAVELLDAEILIK